MQYNFNEGLQAGIRNYEKPNYKYFGSAQRPKLVLHPSKAGLESVGKSQVTVSGIR